MSIFHLLSHNGLKALIDKITAYFYTKTEINDMLSAGMKYEVVNELPATGEAGTFYLVPKQSAGTGDVYDEYIYVDGSFEHIGSTEIDLSNYYTKTQTDDLLGDKVDKESGKGLSTEDFTTAEKTKLSNIEAGAEVNVQSDWNQSDNTKDDFIKNKPTLRQPSTDGTAGQYLKSNGSGNAPSWETMDTAPTENSTKAVTSGGVKTALDGKQASVTITASANTPTDNDTVIMQDSGNTGTTSFLRRKLSTLWNYFKGKDGYPEGRLVWGGKNQNANLSPIDANLISEARANRLARYPLQYMKIEDSRDDGVTWTENTNITDVSKHRLVTDCEGDANGIFLGGSNSQNLADEHCKTRITFTTHTGSSSVLYARIEKICLWIMTNGTTGNTCTVLGRLQTDVEEDNDVWATLGGPATLGGWSDWNVIQTDFTTYGNQKATQYGQFRLLFECTGRGSSSTNIGLSIQKIRAYGMRCWGAQNSLATYNSFFSVDSSDNATFPANVKASKHITNGGTTNQMVAGNGDLKDIAETCKTAVSLNGGKYGFRIIKIDGADYTYLLVLADVTGVYDGTINNKLYGIQGLIFMQRDGATIYNNLVGRITATASYSSSFVRLYTDVVQSDVVKPCVIKKDGRWLLCLSARGNNGTYNATSIIFFGRTYELADEPFTKIRVDSTFTHYYDGGAEIEYIKQASRYPLWASFGGDNTQFVLGDGTLQNSPIPVSKGGTGATTAIGAEYNILNQVADISTTLSDTRKIALCNQTKSASNGVFRWIALSNVWTWIKTHFDSSPTNGSNNGITSGGVYSALEEKVNLQPDFTASQIDYSAGNVGKWQKVLRFPEGADLVINMKKTAMGSDSTSTLWFSSSSMGDSYTSLFGNHSVRFVHDGGYVFLVLACRKSTYEPIESYTFQIAHSSVPMSDIVAVTEASPITATPKEPNIVYRAPMTTGAVSFNVTSGAGSVYMSGHNDFLGNMTSEATNGVTVTMSGATEGQIYRFVFTRNITGGVTFKQSNVAYCTISGDVNAGDTITLTAVSNTAGGWLYEQESAGIESSDGSNIIEYNGSTADVRVNWDKLPARVVMNVAEDDYEDDKNIAIGYGASSYKLTGDEEYPYAYTTKATFEKMKVDGGAEEYTHAVTAGTTYSIVRGSVTTSFTPAYSGYAVILNAGSAVALDTQFLSTVIGRNFSGLYALYDATTSGTNQYIIAVISLNSSSADNIDSNSFATVWVKTNSITPNVAIGNNAKANGSSSTAIGNGASSYGYYCTSLGNSARAVGGSAVAVGANSRADGVGSTAIGRSASSSGLYSSALGNGAQATGTYSVALGAASYANGSGSFACGNNAVADNSNAIALGLNAVDYDMYGIAIGYASGVGGLSEDTNRPYLTAKRFNGVSFNNGTADVYTAYLYNGGDITITLNGASYALTSPSTYPRMLIVVNDSDAQYIYRSLTTCLELDGEFVSTGGNPHTSNATVENLAGNYYAVWLPYNHSSPYVATESVTLFATITSVGCNHNGIAIGNGSKALHDNAFAFGNLLRTLGKIQTVVGSNNKPVEGYFVVGNGTTDSTGRRNCLVIDPSERMIINAGYVGGTQEINMTQQTGVMSNITKSVYRIRWNDTGTVTLTLQAGGCVEGQRVTIYAETNDVHINGCTNDIPQGRFADFLFVNGAWRPMVGY